ncbi:D-glycero-beta-D-manno-heptose 1-phosphate adenylyltransferase [Thermodesulfatator indicus]|uniref:D-glycero-beta-D-manno-heptose 1-phosphate adenylyltransferase n=1 Tax=Thermodesulfatator indicus TaxID=171695 RepID=UPI00059D06B1
MLPLEELCQRVRRRKALGQKLVFTNGCFDLLHAGHVSYLARAREAGDFLVIGLNSDASVKRIKGPERPINPQENRAKVLAALSVVDYVVFFDEDTPEKLIKTLRPDILVKGADWPEEKIVGASFVKSYGGKVLRIPFEHEISTTKIIEKIRKNEA